MHYNVNSFQTIGWPDPFPESDNKEDISDYNKWCRKTNLKQSKDNYFESHDIIPNQVITDYYTNLMDPEQLEKLKELRTLR